MSGHSSLQKVGKTSDVIICCMKRIAILISFVLPLLLMGLSLFIWSPVQAEMNEQVYYTTNTPDAQGRIIYVVQPNDTCLMIELLTGVKVAELTQMNNLDADCTLRPGMELVLSVFTPPTATPGPSPTPTEILPTPTTFKGNGIICAYLFNDINGNGNPDGAESQISGGAVSVASPGGLQSFTGTTTSGVDPICFEELAEGEYNLSMAPPEGYNATTTMNYSLQLKAGDRAIVNFGAQQSSHAAQPVTPSEGGRSPILLIVGLVLILAGAGIGVYFATMKRK